VKLGTRSQDKTDLRLSSLLNEQAQQLQRGGINPMQIFHHEQDRLLLRFGVQPGQEGLQRFLALPLRRQGERLLQTRSRSCSDSKRELWHYRVHLW
jgi:hypothetical protein